MQRVVAGIDEAGVSPRLGPLVVSLAAFRVEGPLSKRRPHDLWKVLSPPVRKVGQRGDGLMVADSKRVFSGRKLEPLERSVLAFVRATSDRPIRSCRHLMESVAPLTAPWPAECPWYREQQLELPMAADPSLIELMSSVLRRTMTRRSIEIADLGAEAVVEPEYNRRVAATDNKLEVVFERTAALIGRALALAGPSGGALIRVDRQGGIQRYGRRLAERLGCSVEVVSESPARSRYRVRPEGAQESSEVEFCVRGEETALAVALASMLSKYVRELYMEKLNRYWAALRPGLKPTAGYPADATRFLAEIDDLIRSRGIEQETLIRQR